MQRPRVYPRQSTGIHAVSPLQTTANFRPCLTSTLLDALVSLLLVSRSAKTIYGLGQAYTLAQCQIRELGMAVGKWPTKLAQGAQSLLIKAAQPAQGLQALRPQLVHAQHIQAELPLRDVRELLPIVCITQILCYPC